MPVVDTSPEMMSSRLCVVGCTNGLRAVIPVTPASLMFDASSCAGCQNVQMFRILIALLPSATASNVIEDAVTVHQPRTVKPC